MAAAAAAAATIPNPYLDLPPTPAPVDTWFLPSLTSSVLLSYVQTNLHHHLHAASECACFPVGAPEVCSFQSTARGLKS